MAWLGVGCALPPHFREQPQAPPAPVPAVSEVPPPRTPATAPRGGNRTPQEGAQSSKPMRPWPTSSVLRLTTPLGSRPVLTSAVWNPWSRAKSQKPGAQGGICVPGARLCTASPRASTLHRPSGAPELWEGAADGGCAVGLRFLQPRGVSWVRSCLRRGDGRCVDRPRGAQPFPLCDVAGVGSAAPICHR